MQTHENQSSSAVESTSSAHIKRYQVNAPGEQIMGRVYDGKAELNSMGRMLPDGSALYASPQAEADQYYLQDSTTYVGNDILWWKKNRCGYTSDLSQAHVFTKSEAQRQHNMRETDIPWPKAYIDQRARPAIDMQYLNRNEALAGTGMALFGEELPNA